MWLPGVLTAGRTIGLSSTALMCLPRVMRGATVHEF